MSLDPRRLAIVLKHANSSPPCDAREQFYAMKQAILQHYGRRAGYDVQEIVHKCWGRRYAPCDDHCDKCGGTGIFDKKIILLERWEFCGLIFHRPLQRLPVAFSEVAPTILGKIEHRFSRLAFASWRVLSMVFAPSWHLYFDQLRMDTKQLKRVKAVLAYLMGFPRDKWAVKTFSLDDVKQASKAVDDVLPIPF